MLVEAEAFGKLLLGQSELLPPLLKALDDLLIPLIAEARRGDAPLGHRPVSAILNESQKLCHCAVEPDAQHRDSQVDDSVDEFIRTRPPTPPTRSSSRPPKKEMSRGQQTAWIVGTLVVLGIGGMYLAARIAPLERNAECQTLFGADRECMINNAAARLGGRAPGAGPDPLDPAPMADPASDVEAAVDGAQTAAEGSSEVDPERQKEIDRRMAEFDREYLGESDLEMGSRQAVELNEMICRETGQNCELAKMARRQHIERYGRF